MAHLLQYKYFDLFYNLFSPLQIVYYKTGQKNRKKIALSAKTDSAI